MIAWAALIEDAAQVHAAALHGQPTGTFGDLATFSFYPTKNLHAIEGGMITTTDPALARTLRLLRNQGMTTRHVPEIIGTNARMSDVGVGLPARWPDPTIPRRPRVPRDDQTASIPRDTATTSHSLSCPD